MWFQTFLEAELQAKTLQNSHHSKSAGKFPVNKGGAEEKSKEGKKVEDSLWLSVLNYKIAYHRKIMILSKENLTQQILTELWNEENHNIQSESGTYCKVVIKQKLRNQGDHLSTN